MTEQKTISPIKNAFEVVSEKAAAVSGAHGEKEQEPVNWYAIRAFKRKVMGIKEDFEKMNFKTYMAMRNVAYEENGHLKYKDEQIIPQLLFVCCPQKALDA